MTIKWNPSLSVGIKEIDEQHKKLVATINKFLKIVELGESKRKVDTLFGELTDYADHHFSTEEHYFDKFNYEKSEEHKKEHKDFSKKIEFLKKKYTKDKENASIETVLFLEDWLFDHLMERDQEYVDCFIKNGLS